MTSGTAFRETYAARAPNPRLERAVRGLWLRREREEQFALATPIGRYHAAAQPHRLESRWALARSMSSLAQGTPVTV
jgi:hypothetical protein